MRFVSSIMSVCLVGALSAEPDATQSSRVEQITSIPGLIAFWDFDKVHESTWASYFDPAVIDRSFPVYLQRIGDHSQYTVGNWPYRDSESLVVFDDSGPFGNAVKFNKGHIYGAVLRDDFDGSALDVHGKKPFTLIAWVKFVGERHLVAGIWDEGGWNRYDGMRQYALFAGLFRQKGVIAHISATGAASFPQSEVDGSQYARLRAIDGQSFENNEWIALGMTYDPDSEEVVAYLDGEMTPLMLDDPVTEDVFSHSSVQSANPFSFKHSIFSPQSFTVKFNGYSYRRDDIKEHRLHVDLKNRTLDYETEPALAADQKSYRVYFDIQRDGRSILTMPVHATLSESRTFHVAKQMAVSNGDVVRSRLETLEKGIWTQVGTEVQRELREGAPFTFGRALGLGSEEIDHGSQLFVDGVAVFNRVLTKEEMTDISFRELRN